MHDGYLVIPFADNTHDGGFAFYDISNPRSPRHVHSIFDPDIREGHAMGFSYSYPGLYAVTQGSYGVVFWDWTDVEHPVKLKELVLPGIEPSDYDNGIWWLFWQAPYVYASGSSRGLFVIDATDPANPQVVDQIPVTSLGMQRAGSVFAIGNLLVLAGNDVPGLATFDIGDPAHPTLLDTDGTKIQYSAMVNGDRILLAGSVLSSGLQVFSIADPTQITFTGGRFLLDKGGYLTVQDEKAHLGVSALGYHKLDLANPFLPVLGIGDFAEPEVDLDFVSALGNLAILSDDHGYGSRIVPHQSAPDTNPPVVNMVNPRDGATGQPVTSRVGVTFTDAIDLRTVTASSFIVEKVGGGAPLAGKYSGQTGIVNWAPAAPLEPNATYRVRIPAGGVRDVVGNPTASDFVSFFSTGPEITPVACEPPTHPASSLVNQAVSFQAVCSGPGLVYSWDFGDGEAPTAWSSSPSISHTYTRAGHFPVIVRADDGGVVLSATSRHTVAHPLTAGAPRNASSIVLDGARRRVWAMNPDADTVTAIDADTATKWLETPVGRDPRGLALTPDGEVWVTNSDDATITVLDASDAHVLATVSLPRASRPHDVVISRDGHDAYVTLEASGEVARLDVASRTLVARGEIGGAARGLALSDDGRLFAGRFVSPADHGEVLELTGGDLSVVRAFALALDPGPDTESSGRGVPNYLLALAVSPDGRRLWVPSKKDNVVRGQFRTGEALTFENTVRAIVSRVDLAADDEVLAERIDLDNRSLPSAIAFTALGDYAFVSTLASNTVDVIDAYTGAKVTSKEGLGRAPIGLAYDATTARLFVHDYMSRDVVVLDVSGVGDGNALTTVATVKTVAHELLDPGTLRGKQIFYDAADDRMSRDDYFACATCHLDGGSDQRVFDFTDRGEGFRNTIDLRGRAGMGHGPVHWTANFDEIQDFEGDIRNHFGGKGFMADAAYFAGTTSQPLGDRKAFKSGELDQLTTYVNSLTAVHPSPYRNADGTLTPDAVAGEAIFRSPATGCTSCHEGSRSTDSSACAIPFVLHDVGTSKPSSGNRLGAPLTGLDTPTLEGLWETAPYLHDGSAPTLLDVLTTANPSDRHGNTSQLTATQLDQLVAYLEQLESPAGPPPPCGDLCGGVVPPSGAPVRGLGVLASLALARLASRRRERARARRATGGSPW
ncbi:MAG: Ig-like domain-containing protein [Deltaproteobacteria bacterium]|nr:Ig-like domain-containing protein [Deltaproteobacteria bacterium]